MNRFLSGPPMRAATVLLCLSFLLFPGLAAAEIDKPSDEVLLTVSGKIAETNADGLARFDRAMLEAIGMQMLKTSTPFEEGAHNYEGILLRDLLKRVGASGDTLIAHAVDGYTVEIPASDAAKFPVILAMTRNGQIMDVSNKGPIWVIYPIDQFRELKTEEISARSIWQLDGLTVE